MPGLFDDTVVSGREGCESITHILSLKNLLWEPGKFQKSFAAKFNLLHF